MILMRYLVHGLLHLVGHEDSEPADRASMEEAQEVLVKALWSRVSGLGMDGYCRAS